MISKNKKPNRLIKEKSLYLLQHAFNPVDWFPWGEEALSRAKQENKPILVSIGYSTCHWCHVMERESFEDPVIAEILNTKFIAIKVDREERPDIDSIYMDALQAMEEQGGWPLNMFLTPETIPIAGGTYFPPEPRYGRKSFKEILTIIYNAWETRRDEIQKSGENLLKFLISIEESENNS
ncbi:MAG: thioredoxin domain-containing protein, partial [Spirochaetia bacterium]|nr:thioredoxin domain-containing protein [Spirochaetia bacterium]